MLGIGKERKGDRNYRGTAKGSEEKEKDGIEEVKEGDRGGEVS